MPILHCGPTVLTYLRPFVCVCVCVRVPVRLRFVRRVYHFRSLCSVRVWLLSVRVCVCE